jgi:elongation factor 1-alpha
MDRQKEERERGVTISVTTKEFFTDKWHYTIIDAPGHRDFIKNMITGASQADVAMIMVPADGNFTTAIQKGNHKAGEIQGQTRQHSRLINLLGVKQIIIGINKMDCDTAGYKKERYDEIANEMRNMLTKVGWKKDFVEGGVPYMPISGWLGDNLIKKTTNMGWWNGVDVKVGSETIHCDTLHDCFDKMCRVPVRPVDAAMRLPISGIYKIKGVGDVLAGRVEQGVVKPNEECIFLPTHTAANPCVGKVFTVEMHHKRVDEAKPGDNVGMNVKNLDKQNMPRSGDVMIYKKDTTLSAVKSFDAQIQVLDIPNEIKTGYSPIGFVRTGRAACRVTGLKWKMGKETGGKKLEDPHALKSNEMAQVTFEPQQPLVADSFKNCEGLSRIAFMDGNGVVMLGKVVTCEAKVFESKKK